MHKQKPFLKVSRAIEDAGFTQKELADELDKNLGCTVSQGGLSQRLHGKTPWRHNEIVAICIAVHIPRDQIGELFFSEVPSE